MMKPMCRLIAMMAVLGLLGAVMPAQCGANPFNFTNNICGGAATFTINPNVACKPFNLPVCNGAWLCVAVAPDVPAAPFADRDIEIGGVVSNRTGGRCDFLVANGHLGSISPTSGQITLVSGTSGVSRTRLCNTQTPGPLPNNAGWTTGGHSFANFSVARLFQFEVTCPGSYTVQLNATTGQDLSALRWRLFDPGTGPGWRPRNANILLGSGTTPSAPVFLNPGWHAIVVFKDSGTVTNTLFYSISFLRQPNPVPTISSTNTLTACAGPQTLAVSGSGFLPCSSVTIDGVPQVPTSLTSSSMTLSLPPQAQPGTLSLTISNPAPGGGAASTQVVVGSGPTPVIAGCNPPFATFGDPGFPLTLNGANFTVTSVVSINGTIRSTTFINASTLQVSVNASDLLTLTPLNCMVTDPCSPQPSNLFPCPIVCGTPTITSLQPSSVTRGSPGFTLTVHGTGFCPLCVVHWNGMPRATNFVSSTQLTAGILSSDLAMAGTATVTVVCPALGSPPQGGGTSNGAVFTIVGPYPGTDEDFVLASGVVPPGAPVTTSMDPGGSIKTASPGDTLVFDLSSPMGTVALRPFYLIADFLPTGSPFTGPAGSPTTVFVGTPTASTFSLLGPTTGALVPLTPLLQPGLNRFAFIAPNGIAGNSLLMQGIVLTPLGNVVAGVMLTDGHEIQF